MSEPAPPAEPRQEGGLKGKLKHKIGPLPTWAWIVVVAAVILAWVLYKSRSSSSSGAQTATTGAGQVPQFVNQTYVSPSPPAAADQDQDEDKDQDQDKGDGKPPHPKPQPRRPPPGDRHGPPLGPPHIVHGTAPGFRHKRRRRDPRMSPA